MATVNFGMLTDGITLADCTCRCPHDSESSPNPEPCCPGWPPAKLCAHVSGYPANIQPGCCGFESWDLELDCGGDGGGGPGFGTNCCAGVVNSVLDHFPGYCQTIITICCPTVGTGSYQICVLGGNDPFTQCVDLDAENSSDSDLIGEFHCSPFHAIATFEMVFGECGGPGIDVPLSIITVEIFECEESS